MLHALSFCCGFHFLSEVVIAWSTPSSGWNFSVLSGSASESSAAGRDSPAPMLLAFCFESWVIFEMIKCALQLLYYHFGRSYPRMCYCVQISSGATLWWIREITSHFNYSAMMHTNIATDLTIWTCVCECWRGPVHRLDLPHHQRSTDPASSLNTERCYGHSYLYI